MKDLIFDVKNHLATITLNRPDQLNSFSEEMILLWIDALTQVRDDDDIYALLVTGNGRAFSTGGDVKTMAAGKGFYESEDDLTSTALARKNSLWKKIQRIPLILQEIDKPVVAKINGDAYGAGLDMALMCDIRIASNQARLCESYFKVGVVPGDGGAYFMPPLTRMDRALDMFWTCKTVSGKEAEQMGLVTYAVEAEELDDFVEHYMQTLLAAPQQAMRFTKRAVVNRDHVSLKVSLDMISSAMAIVTELGEYKKRVDKLAEKIH